jgi:hypothetical protein
MTFILFKTHAGSIRKARRAGSHAAIRLVAAMTTVVPESVRRSQGCK